VAKGPLSLWDTALYGHVVTCYIPAVHQIGQMAERITFQFQSRIDVVFHSTSKLVREIDDAVLIKIDRAAGYQLAAYKWPWFQLGQLVSVKIDIV